MKNKSKGAIGSRKETIPEKKAEPGNSDLNQNDQDSNTIHNDSIIINPHLGNTGQKKDPEDHNTDEFEDYDDSEE